MDLRLKTLACADVEETSMDAVAVEHDDGASLSVAFRALAHPHGRGRVGALRDRQFHCPRIGCDMNGVVHNPIVARHHFLIEPYEEERLHAVVMLRFRQFVIWYS